MLLITSAGLPFTVTSSGELTWNVESVGNGWPGSTPGTVGPRPVACTISTSPALAGFAAVTGEKSEWNTAGPLADVTICGTDIGIKWTIHCCDPPPFRRRLAGSSVIEVPRAAATPGGGATAPNCPRAPRNAPVPPVITKLFPPVTAKGDPGGATPPASPLANNGPDRGTVALQDFEGEHGYCSPHSISDCQAGARGRIET